MSIDQIKTHAASVAAELKNAAAPISPELRARFINVRAALYQRGIYDPVLVRFDSATAPPATPAEVAEQLAAVAAALAN